MYTDVITIWNKWYIVSFISTEIFTVYEYVGRPNKYFIKKKYIQGVFPQPLPAYSLFI